MNKKKYNNTILPLVEKIVIENYKLKFYKSE